MPRLSITLEHEGVTYEAETAKILHPDLGLEDHDIFGFNLAFELSGGGSQQGTGWYQLQTTDPTAEESFSTPAIGTALGLTLIMKIMRTLRVRRWTDLTGLSCLVLRLPDGARFDQIEGIADRDGQRVLIFKDHFAEWHDRATNRRYVDGRED